MLLRKKHNDFGDPTTNKLVNKGVVAFDKDDYVDDGVIRLRDINMIVSMWYIFILSVLLWWLPVFGQMIAGYLGGRKAGSAIRGVVATLIPCLIIIVILIMVDAGLLPSLGMMGGVPSSLVGGISSVSPRAGIYLSGIFSSLGALTGLNGNGLVIIIVFGLIGGMMADMNKKEIAQATDGGGHVYDGLSSFISGANISKLADLVAERVLWTLGAMDQGGKKLLGKSYQEPAAVGFGEFKKLPAPANDFTPQPRLKEWMGPEPEQAFGYEFESPDDIESFPFEESPAITPRRWGGLKKVKHDPYSMEWGVTHRSLSENGIEDHWREQTGRDYQTERGEDLIVVEPLPKPRKRAVTRKRATTPKREKSDAVIYDGNGKELEEKMTNKRKTTPVRKKQPALITRALEKQEKIEEEKKGSEPAPEPKEEPKVEKPKREKIAQSFDML